MFERVAVIGAGVAGTAAAWAAVQRGAQVRVFDAGVGASSLASGAVDDRPWEEVARSIETLDSPALASSIPDSIGVFSGDLGLWELPAVGQPLCRLVSSFGRVRVARGRERGLLDLERLPAGATILLPRIDRPEWDAEGLARVLADDAFVRSRRLKPVAVEAHLQRHRGEERIGVVDFAALHDDASRLDWLTERLRETLERHGAGDAILLGPWTGSIRTHAKTLSDRLGVPVGEIMSPVGGPIGHRFEHARHDLLAASSIVVEASRVTGISSRGELILHQRAGEDVVVDHAILAVGGLAAGGIVFDPPERHAGGTYAARGGCPFRLGLEVPGAIIQARGKAMDVVGSMHGPTLDEGAWPIDADPGMLEAVGLRCDKLRVGQGIWAAGDVVADKPRTMLQAVYLGIVAGAGAAGEPGAISA